MRLALVIAAALFALPAAACPWDRDRPDNTELEDLIAVLGGRFDRPQPAFYRARLERLRPVIAALPESPEERDLPGVLDALPLYDDAAVAMARLGEFNEALVLLDRKVLRCRQVKPLDTPAGKRHHQRALANKVHVLLTRYRAQGGEDHLSHARRVIEEWRELDRFDPEPDWLADEVAWLAAPPAFDERGPLPFPNLLGVTADHLRLTRGQGALAQAGLAGAITHVARRIVHGGLADDPDAYHALGLALWIEGRDEEAITAWLRVNDLVSSGGKTRVRNAPANPVSAMGAHLGELPNMAEQQRLFAEVRQSADEWVKQRNEFIAAKLTAGRHPDTDENFWAGFGQPPLPQPGETQPESEAPVSIALVVGGISAFLVLLFVLAAFTLYVGRRHPGAPTVDEA
ncbi:MAG: hypothetical protein KF696_04150 [Planctomycetes bacterium]|nr:hypothetical protein [Planctomycetota bacterium]MCW8134164.1 hypothetical protein [Planctomycetota bacterium]